MTERITIKYKEIEMTYDTALGEESFDFTTVGADAMDEDVDDGWINIIVLNGGNVRPMTATADDAHLSSDVELAQAVSDADMGGDFIL